MLLASTDEDDGIVTPDMKLHAHVSWQGGVAARFYELIKGTCKCETLVGHGRVSRVSVFNRSTAKTQRAHQLSMN